VRARLEGFVWRVPEWWVWGLVAACWALLAVGTPLNAPESPPHPGHVHSQTQALNLVPVGNFTCLFAMMVPLLLPTLRRTAFASLWQRRQQAIAECLLGYLVIWIASALVLGVITQAPIVRDSQLVVIGGTLLATLAWQRTAMKREALRACHMTLPLAPRSWRADHDCLRLGATVGVNCVITCWPLMALAAATEHQPLAVLAISAFLMIERFGPHIFADTGRAIVLEVQRTSSAGRFATRLAAPRPIQEVSLTSDWREFRHLS